jgi:hypothetical protein
MYWAKAINSGESIMGFWILDFGFWIEYLLPQMNQVSGIKLLDTDRDTHIRPCSLTIKLDCAMPRQI